MNQFALNFRASKVHVTIIRVQKEKRVKKTFFRQKNLYKATFFRLILCLNWKTTVQSEKVRIKWKQKKVLSQSDDKNERRKKGETHEVKNKSSTGTIT